MEKSYKEKFKDFANKIKDDIEIYDSLKSVMFTDIDLKVGDKVMFTNDYGVTFGPHEVLGFCKPSKTGRCIFLDYDCYWFPAKVENVTKIKE